MRILSPYIGGGFGGKMLGPEAVLAAIAAQKIGRPVKIAMARQQLFHNVYRRTDTHQRIRLAADADGKLTAIGHDSVVSQGPDGGFMEPVALGSISLYAAPVRHFTPQGRHARHGDGGRGARAGRGGRPARARIRDGRTGRALGLDPIEFRKRNEPDKRPDDRSALFDARVDRLPR